MRKNKQLNRSSIFPIKVNKLKSLLQSNFKNSPDLAFFIYEHQDKKIAIFFLS